MSDGRILNVTNRGSVRLYEDEDNGNNYAAIQGPTSLAGTFTVEMPDALPAGNQLVTLDDGGKLANVPDGTNGQALITDGAGNLSWATVNAIGVISLQFSYDHGNDIVVADGVPVLIVGGFDNPALHVHHTVDPDGPSILVELDSGGTGIVVEGATYPFNAASGIVLLGDSEPLSNVALDFGNPDLALVTTSQQPAEVLIHTGADANPNFVVVAKTRASDTDVTTAVIEDDILYRLSAYGADGSAYVEAFRMTVTVDDSVVTGAVPAMFKIQSATPGTAPLDGPLAFFTMNTDGSDFFGTTAYDLSQQGGPTFTAGKIGNAVNCGGANGAGASAFLLGDDAVIAALDTGSHTYTCWFKGGSFANDPAILSNWATQPGSVVQWLLWVESGTLKFQVRDALTTTHVASTGFSPSTGTWYFVAAWYNSGTGEVGVRVNSASPVTTTTPSLDTGVDYLGVGTRNNNAACFNGSIDAVGVWPRVLSNSELDDLYNAANGLEPPFSFPLGLIDRFSIDSSGQIGMAATQVQIQGGPLVFDNDTGNDITGTANNWHITITGDATFDDLTVNDVDISGDVTGMSWSILDDGTATLDNITSANWAISTAGDISLNSLTADNFTVTSGGVATFGELLITGKSTLGGLVLTRATKTIASGAFTVNQTMTYIVVTGEGGLADTLDTINGGVDGQIIYLLANDDTHDITVSEAGNIFLNGTSRVVGTEKDVLGLMYRTGTNAWLEISYANNA